MNQDQLATEAARNLALSRISDDMHYLSSNSEVELWEKKYLVNTISM